MYFTTDEELRKDVKPRLYHLLLLEMCIRDSYNGVPTGLAHCAETGCLRQQLSVPSGQRHEICRGLHAEQNADVYKRQVARRGREAG